MSSFDGESSRLARFGVAGGINTAIGFGVILGLTALAVAPAIANAAGYAVGVGFSFLLSKHFVFRSKAKGVWELGPFICCFASAFILNQIVLDAAINILGMRPLWAQLSSIGAYCAIMYLLQRYMVFGASL